jgi:putative membrane protein insertion efficiency factor
VAPTALIGRRRRTIGALAVVLVLFVVSLKAQPLALAGVHGYQRTVAPLVARAGIRCRFTPSCSHYAESVIARDGVIRGGWLALKRVARCGPWTAPATLDAP